MSGGLDAFRELTPEEEAKKDLERQEVEEQIRRIAKIGAECLSDEKFKKYLEEYRYVRERIIGLMKKYSTPDPIQDAFFLRTCIAKIDVFDMLLESITRDSKKKVVKK